MSELFRIKRAWMEHSGGTKFYQAIGITRQTAANGTWSVVAHHYGPVKAAKEGRFSRPVLGGQVDIKRITAPETRHNYDAKIKEKQKGGYGVDKQDVRDFSTEPEFRAEIVVMYGADRAHTIFQHLGLDTGSYATDEPEPSPEPEDTTIERPEAWGAW